jgi:hypothetical protein
MAVIGRSSPFLVGSALTLLATFAAARGAAGAAARAAGSGPGSQAPTAAVDFARDVQPLLEKHCHECRHQESAAGCGCTAPASPRRERAGHPRDTEQNPLMRVLGLGGDDRMPLDADPLSDAELSAARPDRRGRGDAGGAGQTTAAADVASTGPTSSRRGRPCRPSRARPGCARRSIASSSRGWITRSCRRRPRPIATRCCGA